MASAVTAPRVELHAVPGLPRLHEGDDLVRLTLAGIDGAGIGLRNGDVIVFAQKVVSKVEGRRIDLARVTASPRAIDLAAQVRKDARLVELILSESVRVVRACPDVLIVEHRLGFVMANAGVDQSNVADAADGEFALLLPLDPDASAARLRAEFGRIAGVDVGVLISDSFGRPWRYGAVGVAIGCAGLAALRDLRGQPDLFGRTLRVTEVAQADEIASAASMLMGQGAEGLPVVVVRGLPAGGEPGPARALVRPASEDLFR